MNRVKYDQEVIDYVIENHKGKTLIELAEMVNKEFNLNITNKHIGNLKSRLKRRKGIYLEPSPNDGRYRKGSIPANKGKKWNEYLTKEQQEKAKATCFKKGNVPANHKEIGSERISKDGYLEIKVRDRCGNDNWEYKHRYIYEQHYGKIPEGYNVIFLDGNRRNLDINNLKAVSKAEDLIMNRNKLFTKDREITNTGTILAQVIDKVNKRQNERKKH